MEVTMALFWYILAVSVIGSQAAGEFSVLHSPESIKFSGSSKILESLLKEICSASLGLSVEENSEWNGVSISDPFNTPEAVVEVYVDGVSSLRNSAASKAKTFPLTVDEYEPDTFEALKHRINQRFTNGGNKLVNIRLSEPTDFTLYADVFGVIIPPKVPKQSLQHLKTSAEEDSQFLSELEALKALTDKVRNGAISADNIVDFYNLRFRSLHALSDFHGPNSLQTKEAKKLLSDALEQLSDAFVKAYDGSVLVTVVATDVAHTRRAVRSVPNERQASAAYVQLEDEEAAPVESPPESPAESPPESPPEAGGDSGSASTAHQDDSYTADYAAIFNIMLWFGVVFTFTLVAIVYAIMDMDPGRDSIIYRMTSTRMKKDN